MNKTFDIGAKVYINDGIIKFEDFYVIAIDNDNNFAEIISDNEPGVFLPLVTSVYDTGYCLLPGFLPKGTYFDDLSIFHVIDELKYRFIGKEYEFTDLFLEFFINKFTDPMVNYEHTDFDLLKLRNSVKESIINQDELVDKVITSLVFNQKLIEKDIDIDKIRLSKKTLLVFGKTGTGKTEVMKQVAKEVNIPYVIEDANKFTIDGYKGRDVSDMLVDLYRASNYNLEEAESGILILDEFDKKCETSDVSPAVTTGVQQTLLKMIEGDKFLLNLENGTTKEEIVFDTSRLTVFLMGSFAGREKNRNRTIGFGSTTSIEKYTEDDLISFGIIPELVGRISSVCKTNDFSADDLKNIILNSKISTLKLIQEIYETFGIALTFTDEFIDKLAKSALDKKVGARGIKSAFEEIFEKVEFDILNGDYKEIIFEKDNVKKVRFRKVEKSIEL